MPATTTRPTPSLWPTATYRSSPSWRPPTAWHGALPRRLARPAVSRTSPAGPRRSASRSPDRSIPWAVLTRCVRERPEVGGGRVGGVVCREGRLFWGTPPPLTAACFAWPGARRRRLPRSPCGRRLRELRSVGPGLAAYAEPARLDVPGAYPARPVDARAHWLPLRFAPPLAIPSCLLFFIFAPWLPLGCQPSAHICLGLARRYLTSHFTPPPPFPYPFLANRNALRARGRHRVWNAGRCWGRRRCRRSRDCRRGCRAGNGGTGALPCPPCGGRLGSVVGCCCCWLMLLLLILERPVYAAALSLCRWPFLASRWHFLFSLHNHKHTSLNHPLGDGHRRCCTRLSCRCGTSTPTLACR